ncbi:Hint domain-containing protein, partial [Methylorubrum zatmanii]
GGGLPVNDLFLSPGHPVLVGADADNEGGVLVPVMCLINGTTITRAPRATVTYWHVELDAHDILLAEGLPAESYIDGGDRAFFAEASDHALHNPDFVAPGWNGRCRPVAVDGPVVEAERLRLDAVFAGSLAAQCEWDGESAWAAA